MSGPKLLFQLDFTAAAGHGKMPSAYERSNPYFDERMTADQARIIHELVGRNEQLLILPELRSQAK
jgi:hypothetical protein